MLPKVLAQRKLLALTKVWALRKSVTKKNVGTNKSVGTTKSVGTEKSVGAVKIVRKKKSWDTTDRFVRLLHPPCGYVLQEVQICRLLLRLHACMRACTRMYTCVLKCRIPQAWVPPLPPPAPSLPTPLNANKLIPHEALRRDSVSPWPLLQRPSPWRAPIKSWSIWLWPI